MSKIRKLLVLLMTVALLSCVSALAIGCDCNQGFNPQGRQSENAVTELSLEGWTYGEQANTPTAVCTYGTAVFTYSTSEDGEFTATVPTDAGVYFVKATVAETTEYKGAEKVVSFTISRANNVIAGFGIEDVVDIVCHGTPSFNATATVGNVTYTFATEESGEYGAAPSVFTVGTYFVKATTEGNANYNSVSIIRSFDVIHSIEEIASPEYLKTEADCSHYAVYYKSCSACGQKIEQETFDYEEGGFGEHKHVSHVAEVPATCQAVGYTEGGYCSDCGEYISGHEVINKTAHVWEIDQENCKEPTCTEKGVIAYKCSNDGCTETYTEEGDDAIGHLVSVWTKTGESKVPGTDRCEYQITYTGVCEHCQAPQTRTETVEKHNFYYAVTTEPTCQHDGEKTEYCLVEDCIYHSQAHGTAAYPLPEGSDGHDWQETSTANVYKCSHCHATKTVVSTTENIMEDVSVDDLDGVDEIQLSTASVSMDDGVKGQLTGTFTISAEEITDKSTVNTDLLSEEEKVQFSNAKAVYDFKLESNGEALSNFGEDNYITIKIPYVLQAGDNPDKIIVWCVREDGTAEPFDASYANGYITFKTNHFSIYTVVEMTAEEYCAVNNCHSDEYIAANPDKFLVVEPTCTIGGYTVCLNCGEIIRNTPATGHKWHSHTVSAVTCTENGQVHHECSVCGIGYETYVPATGHYYIISEQISATCTERGSVTYECTHCHDSYTVYTAKTDHRYVIETVEATCTSDGYTKKTCHLCGSETVTGIVPALGHVYGNEWLKTADGHYHVCSRCGEDDGIVPHVPGAEATETTAQICTDCGYILNPSIGHICKLHLTEVSAKDADCLNGGNVRYFVCECGKWYLDEDAEQLIEDHLTVYTDALGHDIVQSPAIEPTCEDVGYTAGMWCNRCNKWVKGHVEIPATGHVYTATVIKATCENGGKTVYTCTACGHSYEGNYTSALGHKYNATVHAPTCTEIGYTEYVCSICGDHYIGDETPALGHKISTVWNKDEDLHWHACGRCGEKFDVAEHTPDYAEATESHGIKCTVCGYQIAERLDHVHNGVKHEGKDPTCTEGGNREYYVCSCGDWFYDEACENKVENKSDLMIKPNGHATELHKGVPATCVSEGRTDGYYCTVCEKWISGNKIIPVNPDNHAHLQHNEEVPATCVSEGVIEHWICDDCNKTFADKACTVEITDKAELVIPTIAHDYESKVVEPTCTEKGYTIYICRACGDSYTADETPALGHTFGKEWKADEDGHFHVCEVCGALSEKEAHVPDYEQATEEHGVTCTVCGYEIEGQLAHTHVGVKHEEVPSTCTENGTIEYYECACGKLFYDEECTKQIIDESELIIPSHGHEYESEVVDPTCTTKGYTLHTCSLCGDTYKDEYTDATGHSYKDKVVKPTCTEGGFTLHVCEICNDTYIDEETEALKHNFKETWESNEKGHYHVCARCGIPSEIEAHIPDYEQATEEHGITCTVCGYEIERPAAHVHKGVKQEEVPATCTSDGIKEHYVCKCGDIFLDEDCTEKVADESDLIIPALKHDYQVERVVEPTCTEQGYTVYTCSRCGETYKDDYTAPLKHDYEVSDVVEPTCTEIGYTVYTCTRCGDSYVGDRKDALGHDYSEPAYVWADDMKSVKATRWCLREEKIMDEITTLYVTSRVVQERSCTNDEITEYVAEFSHVAFTTQTKRVVTAKAYGHTASAWGYDENGHYHICTVCGEKFDEGAHVPDYEEATTEHGITCTVCGYEIAPKQEQQEDKPIYSYTTTVDMGETVIVFKAEFYKENNAAVMSRTINGRTETENSTWSLINGKILVEVDDMYLTFTVYEDKTIEPFVQDAEIVYTVEIDGNECTLYEGGIYGYNIGGIQFTNDWYEEDGIVYVLYHGDGYMFTVNADNTLSPYEGQQEDKPKYSYSATITEDGMEVTYAADFYKDGKAKFAKTIKGQSYGFESNWEINSGYILSEVDDMYIQFVINANGTIAPYIKNNAMYLASVVIDGNTCMIYSDNRYVYNFGTWQYSNFWEETDNKIILNYHGENRIFLIGEDDELIPYEEPQGKVELYRYEGSYAGPTGEVTTTFIFYNDNTYEANTVSGGELVYHEEDDYNIVDGKITLYAQTEGMYYSFVFNGDTIIPYFKDGEVKYTTLLYDYLDCTFYADGVWTFNMSGVQFFNNYTERDGKVIIVFAGQTVILTIDKDGVTLIPYEEPQGEKEVLYSFSDRIEMGGYVVTYHYIFYTDNTYCFISVYGGEDEDETPGNWKDVDNKITINVDGMNVSFAIENGKISPYIKDDSEIKYTGQIFDGTYDCNFYEDGVYTFMIGKTQFFNNWYEQGDKVIVYLTQGPQTYVVNADGITISPYQGGGQPEEPAKVLYMYDEDVTIDGKIVGYGTYKIFDNGTAKVNISTREFGWNAEGHWRLENYDGVQVYALDLGRLAVDFTVDGDDKLVPYVLNMEEPLFVGYYNGLVFEFSNFTYQYVYGNCQFYGKYQVKDEKFISIEYFSVELKFIINADGSLSVQGGEQTELKFDYKDMIEEDGEVVAEAEYVLYTDNTVILTVRGKTNEQLEGNWELKIDDDNVEYILCTFGDLSVIFDIDGDSLIPWINDDMDIVYTANYNGTEIRFSEDEYDFTFGSCQFYGDYTIYEEKYIDVELVGESVTFEIKDGNLVPYEKPQTEIVYTFKDVFTELGNMEITCNLNSDFTLTGEFKVNGGSQNFEGSWEYFDDNNIRCTVFGLHFDFSVKEGRIIPYIHNVEGEPIYTTVYNGVTINFYDGVYYFSTGRCQFYSNYKLNGDEIRIVFIGDDVKFKVNADGSLVPEGQGEDPQGKEPLYTFVNAQSSGSQTLIITYNFYEENNQLLLVADMGGTQSTLPGTWHYDVEGRVVAEADYGMGGVFTVNPDGKTLTPYVEEIEEDLVYTSSFQGMGMSFYANGKLQLSMGGQTMSGTWSVVKEGVVGADIGGEVLYLTINDDGETLTPVTDETTIFVYRVAVINDKGEYIATADIKFTYYDPSVYPDMRYQYESVTPITFEEAGMIKIEKSLDGVNYVKETDIQYGVAGTYQVIYQRSLNGSSSYSVNNMKNYDLPMVGTVEYEDGEYYAKGKDGNKVALTYTENDGIYHFVLFEIEEQYGHGFYDMYYVLEGRKFKIFIPETEANYTLSRDHYTIKLYDGGYLVFSESNSKYCIAYSLMEDGEGNTYLVANGRSILNVLGEIPYVIKNGILVDGWKEGDIQDEVRVTGFGYDGDYSFIVGQSSMDDIKFRLEYSNGDRETIPASQVNISGRIDFNTAGEYRIIAIYKVDDMNSFQTEVTVKVGNPDDIRGRYIDGSNVTWILNERGIAEVDLTGVYMVEYTFDDTYTRRQLTVSDLNSVDYNVALRGTSKSTYTVRTIYTLINDIRRYYSIQVTTITKADLIECYENTKIQGDLFYSLDKGEFIVMPGMSEARMTVYYGITTDDETGYSYYRTYPLIVPFTMDLFNLDGNDFTANAGVYENVIVGNGLTDFVGSVKVTSFRTEDVQPTVIIGNIKTQQYVSLPDAYIGEDVEEYADRVYNFFSSDEIVIMYVHMANNVGLDSQMLKTIDRNQLDLRSFDSSNRGVTKVVINFENFLGIQEAIELNVNVVA